MRNIFVLLSLLGFVLSPAITLAAVPSTPTNLQIVGGQYTNDTTPTFTWTAVPGATHYDYKLNDDNYRGIGNATSFTVPSARDGWHTFQLRAQDGTGNNSAVAALTFEVDTKGPSLTAVTPTTATALQPITLSVTASGEAWTSSCRLTADGNDVGVMHERNQTFSATTTFTTTGKHKVFATCVDGDGNATVGSATTITVNASWQAGQGSIVKTATSSTVYYYGDDGMRHAFPNEVTFWSWYDNYDSLRVVTDDFIASLPLGDNVTLRPGSALVRFTTDNNVYAVDTGTKLRKYVSAYLTLLEYGTNWTSLFVTLPDVLRGNYGTGADITEAGDYDKEAAWDSVHGIGDLFPW